MNKKFLVKMAADKFNRCFEIGSPFLYFPIKSGDTAFSVTTRSEAWSLGHGEAVVSVSNVSGGVALTHLASVLSELQLNTLASVVNGADIYSRNLAGIYREIEKIAPVLIDICEPQAYQGDGTDQVPFFGVIATPEGVDYLAAFGIDSKEQTRIGSVG
ncbi:hypothetical protein [Serratia fonticola]|uniref:hypothetical protein n=1 Tax=Serratia fonticola TaxID=47917 RepID=UPI0027E783BF|nr:hypothetical protein [Serratia fonticola]MDQ7212528.1 hypothetical protein [Serratia fonticola]HBE9082707.1 hypothetical protein [Serratia fonticola]HBE9093260.1 hypothetical protein [Serratia fonticola]HBE9155557.1 hypothetical protein [Serratia fonticola]